jgi:hypothetical protein
MPGSSKTTDRMTSSLVGTFELPFKLIPSLTHTETSTNTTLLWPYNRSSRETVFVPSELSHEYTINFGTIPDSEKDPTNIKGVNTSMRRLTRDRVTLSLKISIPEKLNKQPDMRFSILFENNVIWECYPHTNRQIGLLTKTSIPNYSVFRISNSGCFDRTYSLDQLIQNQHRSPCTRSHSNIRKIKFHLTMKPDPNGSLTCTTKITIVFSEHLENLKRAPSDKNGVLWRKVFTTKETKFARDPNAQIKLVTRHAHTHTVISYRKGSPSSSPFSALSPAAPQKKSASKCPSPDSDHPLVKKPRISSFDCTQASLPQISLNERPTSGFLPHDPELAEFFESFNGPMDLSLNSPSPPNFDFPSSDDPLKKLLQLLNSPDETRSPSSARLYPIFNSNLFDKNSK